MDWFGVVQLLLIPAIAQTNPANSFSVLLQPLTVPALPGRSISQLGLSVPEDCYAHRKGIIPPPQTCSYSFRSAGLSLLAAI
jgi:hypothetical protein